MYDRKGFISNGFQRKTRRIQTVLNRQIPVENQLHL